MNYIKILNDILKENTDAYDVLTIINKDCIPEYTLRLNNTFELEEYDNERMGKNILDTFEGLTEENSSVIKVLKTGRVQKSENQLLKIGNTRILVKGHSYPIFDENGQIQGAVDALKYLKIYTSSDDKKKADEGVLDHIVTENRGLKNIKKSLHQIAMNDSNVFLQGETGTGKGVFAKAIHQLSARWDKPFISQNCAAIPPNLMESTFFGTEKGGFTGAESKKGLFELANHGTLFLDEINSMDTYMQSKLLSVLEEKTIRRIGGEKDIALDVRIISASNEEPHDLVQCGKIREDFYYRISPVRIKLPPLRERKEDVLPLTEFFIDFFNKKMGKNIKGATDMTLTTFESWDWPGNVRELRNTIEGAFNVEKSDVITLNSIKDLLDDMRETRSKDAAAPATAEAERENDASKYYNLGVIKRAMEQQNLSLDSILQTIEKEIIEDAMMENRRLNTVAAKLGISPQKLNYKLGKLQIKK